MYELNGIVIGSPIEETVPKNKREHKGQSIIALPTDYVVIDIETTGLSSNYDDIIELAAIKVKNDQVVGEYQSLVDPEYEIDPFISDLTGITNEMLKTAPKIEIVLPDFLKFVGDSVVLGHNVSFDVNFIYDTEEYLGIGFFSNDHIDTRRIYRKLFPDREHHRLIDMVNEFNVGTTQFHRALADCYSAYKCFVLLKNAIASRFESDEEFIDLFKKKYGGKSKADAKQIKAQTDTFDETHPLYNMSCVFTGALEKMTRAEAMQIVVNVGGKCENNVTKKTNYLIIGNLDYCSNVKGQKSSKMKKAEDYKLKGYDITVIPESVFYDMLDYGKEE